MGRAIDLVYDVFLEVESNGELMLGEDFIMGIFSPLYVELPEFEQYLTYFFEEKESNVIVSCSRGDRVLAIDLAQCEVFYPTRILICVLVIDEDGCRFGHHLQRRASDSSKTR